MLRNDAIEIWKAGVAAVHGRTLAENSVQIRGSQLSVNEHAFDLDNFDRILVVGGGKFSHFMAEGIENVLGADLAKQKRLSGLVTVPDGSNSHVELNFIESAECRPAGVNLPTDRVLAATERMLRLLQGADEKTLVLALISGGGSALLENTTLSLEDIVTATNWLGLRGANILELNTVRIALSDIKGGGLARAIPAGTLIGLIVSDVPNDDLRFVSSGPTVEFGDPLFPDAKRVLEKFSATVDSGFPATAIERIDSGVPSSGSSANVANVLIGDANVARNAAVAKAASLGYEVLDDILADTTTCDEVADVVVQWCAEPRSSKQCVISLGEPVVEPGENAGRGGRNQHAVLEAIASLIDLSAVGEFCFMSAGTDGEDGNTSVAGALVSDQDILKLTSESAAIDESLKCFDSHRFLAARGLVFDSGATGTNVADLRVQLRG